MAKNDCNQCERKCGADRPVEPAIIRELDEGFETLLRCNSKSLLRKHLDKEICDKLKTKRTLYGSTLLDCVQSCFANHDSTCGIFAPDPDAFITYQEIFNPILSDCHYGFKEDDQHPETNWGNLDTLKNLDPEGKYISSIKVRVSRSLKGYPFAPVLTKQDYKDLEEKITNSLILLTGELMGRYYPIIGMPKKEQDYLISNNYLFKECDRIHKMANIGRYWPHGRGVYYNVKKTFLVWINSKDHMRIISMQPDGDLPTVYNRLIRGVAEIEKNLKTIRHSRLGYLTVCPMNLGSTLKASVNIKLPCISRNYEPLLETIAEKYALCIEVPTKSHIENETKIYNISNRRTLGVTEYEGVKALQDGILELIETEKKVNRQERKAENMRKRLSA